MEWVRRLVSVGTDRRRRTERSVFYLDGADKDEVMIVPKNTSLEVYVYTMAYPENTRSFDVYALDEQNKWNVVNECDSSLTKKLDLYDVKSVFVGDRRYTAICSWTNVIFLADLDHLHLQPTQLSSPDHLIHYVDLAAVRGTIYMYDKLGLEKSDRRFYAYDCKTDKWRKASALLNPQSNYTDCRLSSFVSMDNVLYLLGGVQNGSDDLVGCAQCYDDRVGSWMRLPYMSNIHDVGKACAHDGQLYVSGGNAEPTSVEVFDPTAQAWRQPALMPQQKSNHSMVSYKNKLWVLGGVNQNMDICIYDPVTDSWTEDKTVFRDLVKSRPGGRCARVLDAVVRPHL